MPVITYFAMPPFSRGVERGAVLAGPRLYGLRCLPDEYLT
jgi:hypothetical protein